MPITFVVAVLALGAGAENVALAGLSAPTQVYQDKHAVPHVYAANWPDASRTLGYLHARDRLWQMDAFRRQAAGRAAELAGKGALGEDILMRRLGIRRGCEEVIAAGLPDDVMAELEAYAAGVNARIAEVGEKGLPILFKTMKYAPEPWKPVDCLLFIKYMAWDQSGTRDDLWFGMMVEKMGFADVEALWPLDRPYEIPTVRTHAPPAKASIRSALRPIPGMADAYLAAHRKLDCRRFFGPMTSFGSNNWAIDGSKTKSGKPILCNDPHLGFYLPSIWYVCHLSAGGQNVAGATFPGSPLVVVGHNDHIAWGITNMQADACDYFVETLHPSDPTLYKHRGEWKKLRRVSEDLAVRGEKPTRLDIDYTVHGPIVERGERAISLQWTGLGPTREIIAFHRVNRAKGPNEFLAALKDLTVPAINLVYADVAGNVMIHPCGALPLRTPGEGRIPMDGATGDHDWVGMIPSDELPLAVNPAEGFVASANGRPAGVGYPHYLGWMWDPSYRTRRIDDMLRGAKDVTIESMATIQNDAYDKAAERFVPALLAGLRAETLEDPFAREVAKTLQKWDFVADRDSLGPAIWMRWLSLYRRAVWDDEWKPRGIDQVGGSWGFCGDNRREPMLEVLEYLTCEKPNSIWFDDRATPERENRDDIARRSFLAAVASLRKDFGDDIRQWSWGKINKLRVRSLTDVEALARGGMPIVGTAFTVNPGGDIGTVGGGASFRMIVDFGDLASSVGVYPGGQVENPLSPQYADQIKPWSEGEYLPLRMIGDPERLPAEAKVREYHFAP